MSKFLIVFFGFLGFAFYELSGGAEFDGEALRLSRVEAGPLKPAFPDVVVVTADADGSDANFAVTRASFNLVENDKLKSDDVAASVPINDEPEITQASLVIEQDEAPESQIILPSLIAPSASATVNVVIEQVSNAQDVRIVSSNRVNVRGGPSTDFEIVGKLNRGAEVEILVDNGDGWVEMRSLDGATIGWMADFLLDNG